MYVWFTNLPIWTFLRNELFRYSYYVLTQPCIRAKISSHNNSVRCATLPLRTRLHVLSREVKKNMKLLAFLRCLLVFPHSTREMALRGCLKGSWWWVVRSRQFFYKMSWLEHSWLMDSFLRRHYPVASSWWYSSGSAIVRMYVTKKSMRLEMI